MAPITRSRSVDPGKIIESKNVKKTDTDSVSPRGKRKSIGDENDSEDDDNEGGAPIIPEISSPKRQRLVMRTREDESTATGQKTLLEVEIPMPVSSTPKPTKPRSSSIPDSQDGAEVTLESDPDAEPSSASKQLEEEASQQLASQSNEPDSTTPMPKPKGKHLVFGDDNDVENFVAAAATRVSKKVEVADEEEGSDDDDDDAPEAVSTQAAAKKVQMAAQVASEAAEKQAASLKRKRQDKDNLYKQQAERRKRARGTVEVHQTKPKSKDRASSTDDGVAEVETAVTAGGRRRAQRVNLPAVLPAEFLTDSSSSSSSEDEEAAEERAAKKPRKINFDDDDDDKGKRPKDRVVGATRYRVLPERGDQALAPRLRKDARASKESLLKRRRAGVVPGVAGKKGFFVRR
ncbi:hypothetical protein F4804DRAFT_319092 [Jackrogersella minutella]|nr:hypothetical protein F4804DRAFT_319092 [Jackrogersella minutella]